MAYRLLSEKQASSRASAASVNGRLKGGKQRVAVTPVVCGWPNLLVAASSGYTIMNEGLAVIAARNVTSTDSPLWVPLCACATRILVGTTAAALYCRRCARRPVA